VRAAALTRVVPLTSSGYSPGLLQSPRQDGDSQDVRADWNLITPGYFDTLSTALVRGRAFTSEDRAGAPEVAIVNETLARRTWANQDPIGQTLRYTEDEKVWRTLQIVGMVRDGKYRSLGEAPRSFIYVPIGQHYTNHELWLLVRSEGAVVAPALRTLVRQMDPNMPFTLITSLSNVTGVYLLPHRIAAWLAGAVALIGMLLAALGIYGVTAYTVGQRTREIGLRVALGAKRGEVLSLVTRQGVTLAVTGMVLGLCGAVLVTRLLASMLYGIEPLDPLSFAGGGMLLIVIALIASLIPARRAVRMDPVAALRYE
jgi:putative ABC transport system permease protein